MLKNLKSLERQAHRKLLVNDILPVIVSYPKPRFEFFLPPQL